MSRPPRMRGTKGKDGPRRDLGGALQNSSRGAEPMEGADPRSPRRIAQAAAVISLVFLVAGLYGRTVGFGFTRTDYKVLLNDDAAFVQDPCSLFKVFGRPCFPESPR